MGLDNWHTDEFAWLSRKAYQHLADLLNAVEEGAQNDGVHSTEE